MYALDFLSGKPYNMVILIVTLLSIVVTIYFAQKTLRVGRRRVSVSALWAAPLLTDHSKTVNDLQVTYNGVPLPNPHVATFIVSNYGRVAVDSSHFDQGRPIRLNLGVPVVEVLKVSLRPSTGATFVYSQEPQAVTLGPDVLRPSQSLSVQVLLKGKPSLEEPLEEYLTGTDVEYVPPGSIPKFRPRSKFDIVASVLSVAAVSLLTLTLLSVPVWAFTRPDTGIDFTPRGARTGQSVEVWGWEFTPNQRVFLSVECGGDSVDPLIPEGARVAFPLAQPTTDSSGSFRARAVIPSVPSLDECSLTGRQEVSGWFATPREARRDFD